MAPIRPSGRPSAIGDTGRTPEEPSQADNQRWDTSSLSLASPNALTPIAVPTLAPIPSPLAIFLGSDAWLLRLVDERASPCVRDLFGRIRQVNLDQDVNFDLSEIMLVGSLPTISPLSADRETAFVVYLERRKHDMVEEEQGHDLATSFELRYEWIRNNNHFIRPDAVRPMSRRPSAQPGQFMPRWGSSLEIRRLPSTNSADGTSQCFFIFNSASTSLWVNGVMYGTSAVVGPLPDFAVIETGKAAVFWWHTDKSIDYLPSLKDEIGESKKRPLSIGDGYINLANFCPPKKQRLTEGSERPRETAVVGPSPSGVPASHPGRPPRNPSPPPLAPPRMPRPPPGNHPWPGPPRKRGSESPKGPPPPPPVDPPNKPGQTPKVPPSGPVPSSGPPRPQTPPQTPGRIPKRPSSGPPPPTTPKTPEKTPKRPSSGPPPPPTPPKTPVKPPKRPSSGPAPPPTDPPKKPGKTRKRPSSGPAPPVNKPPTKRKSTLLESVSRYSIAAWRHEFQRRLKEMQTKASKTPDDANSAHQVVSSVFGYDDPAMAIASVWEGLKFEGVNYAFGDPRLFQYARRIMWLNLSCVGAPHPLIMPLVFSESFKDPEPEEETDVKPVPPTKSVDQMKKEQQEILDAERLAIKTRMETKSGAERWDPGPKQFVLALAQRDPSSETGVSITYMNSGSVPSQGIIRAAARNIVRNSSWMPEGTWPSFSREIWQTVPQQADKSTGGTNLVMNAWAHMLNLIVNETWSISSEEQNKFYEEARTVINLALRGHMNGNTILSFLTGYEYARYQSTAHAHELPPNMQSAFMNHDVLSDIVDRMKKEDNKVGSGPAAPPPTTAPPTAPVPSTGTGPIVKPPSTTQKPPSTTQKPPSTTNKPPSTTNKPPSTTKKPQSNTKKPGPQPPPASTSVPAGGIRIKGKTEWATKLQNSLDACQAKYKDLNKNELHTVAKEELTDEDVTLGIAAVWRALWTDDIRFAFGTANLFRLSRTPSTAKDWHGFVSIGAPNDFIMPLLFNPDDTEEGEEPMGAERAVGHFLLAIASRDSEDSTTITIQIQDSMEGHKDLDEIRDTVQNIVRYSGWMGLTPEGMPLNVQPNFEEEVITVPQQTGVIECGFHVIFNAWAYMLGIPIINASQRSGTGLGLRDRDFYACGLRMVNLALGGCLDATTIQAFFNHFGYCEAQDPADAVQEMESVMMDDDILADIIQEIVDEEKATATSKGPAQGPAQNGNGDGNGDGEEDGEGGRKEDGDENGDDGGDGDGNEDGNDGKAENPAED